MKIDFTNPDRKNSARMSPRKSSRRSKRRGESISTTKAIHDFVEYSKLTPLHVLKEAFIEAKIQEGINSEDAIALFES